MIDIQCEKHGHQRGVMIGTPSDCNVMCPKCYTEAMGKGVGDVPTIEDDGMVGADPWPRPSTPAPVSEERGFDASVHEPPPKPGGQRVLDLVLKDFNDRAETGREKYGTYLETDNGRDALMDAYQEACDLVMYLRQAMAERDGQ